MAVNISQVVEQFSMKQGLGNWCYGITKKGIPYSLYSVPNNNMLTIHFSIHQEIADFEQFKQALKAIKFRYAKRKFGGYLSTSNRKNLTERVEQMFELVDQYCQGVQECPLCHQSNGDSVGVVNDLYQTVHATCYKHQFEEKREQVEKNEGNYITGMIGAFLGALAITLVGLLVMKMTNTSYGIIFGATGMIAATGYMKLKGKHGNVGKILVIMASLIAFIVYLYCLVLFIGYDGMPLDILFLLIPRVTSVVFSLDFLVESCWFEILFFGLGLLLVLFHKDLSGQHKIACLEKDREFLQPLHQDARYYTES